MITDEQAQRNADILKGARLAAIAERIRIADEIERLDSLDTCPMCPRDIAAIVRKGLSRGAETIDLAALRSENARLRDLQLKLEMLSDRDGFIEWCKQYRATTPYAINGHIVKMMLDAWEESRRQTRAALAHDAKE